MLQRNCRIEDFNGLRFYEQDILFDDYEFAGNVQITLRAKYLNPGIGIALINSEGLSIRDKNELYLFRIGANETSVLYKKDGITKRILRNSINPKIPYENFELTLKKIDRKAYVYMNGELLFDMLMPTRLDTCNIGIYSNAGNTITGLSIASNIPDGWMVNMSNTNGGYISFIKDGFTITGCSNDAQIEQESIQLSAGTYYLNYIKEGDNNDIRCYAYASDDNRPFDDDKSIMENGTIYLPYDMAINIKFAGTEGTIKNVHISESPLDRYVETRTENVSIEGSYIVIYTTDGSKQNISRAEWTATIYDTPNILSQNPEDEFFVVADSVNKYKLTDLGILVNNEYKYVFDVASNTLTVHNDTFSKTIVLNSIVDRITVLKNVDATVTNFVVTDMVGNKTILTLQRDMKKYVENSIAGPIIATWENQGVVSPLDLSSSYRMFFNGEYDEYIFTNVEREVFDVSNGIRVENAISDMDGAVKIYGIRHKDSCNLDNILRLSNKDIDNISSMTSDYVILDNSYIGSIKTTTGEISLNGVKESGEFELLVIDYLKKDSYAINEQYDDQNYEVQISSTRDNIKLVYSSREMSGSDKDLELLTDHKITGITPQDNCYIILKKEA